MLSHLDFPIMHGRENLVSSKDYSRILPCFFDVVTYVSKDPKPILHPHIFLGSEGRETVILTNHVLELMEVRLPVAEKVTFPSSWIKPNVCNKYNCCGPCT